MKESVGDVFSIAKSSDVLPFTTISKVPFIPRGFCGALDVKVDVDYWKISLTNYHYSHLEIPKSNLLVQLQFICMDTLNMDATILSSK